MTILSGLTACTRDRPTPEPTDTSEAAVQSLGDQQVEGQNSTESGGEDSGSNAEPQVLTSTPTPDPTLTESTDNSGENASQGAARDVFQYTVEAGDTVTSLALKYETDVDSIRELNFLVDDNILVGQVLRIPLGEGITPEGRPTPTPEPYFYTVQPGDTLYGIALRFDLDPLTLTTANEIVDQNSVFVGQELLIPNYQPPALNPATNAPGGVADGAGNNATSGSQAIHIVQRGETLSAIAELYGVSVGEIAAANNIQNRDLMRLGQQLVIPGITARDAALVTQLIHVVQSGESLLAIAEQYGVSGAALAEANGIENTDLILPGQELVIPTN
ncbi:LysM peptidoglycan-binding domain-containing protein [Chloroflexi bacterium TSY]|nr:LysM peptidoglycan-binding domain-containing protein [Chloroflexi bacterium TSY]